MALVVGGPGALSAHAQPSAKVVRVGVLYPAPDNPVFRKNFEGFRQRLLELGYVEGQNLKIEYWLASGTDTLSKLATDLVRSKPDVIIAVAPAGVRAAHEATATIPIVAIDLESDPIAAGFVAHLARPGGNITGVFLDFPELAGKWLEMLKEAVPKTSRVAVLWDAATGPAQVRAAETAARTLRLRLHVLQVRGPDFEAAFRSAITDQAQALLVLSSPVLNTSRKEIVGLAIKNRLPSIMPFPDFADDGGLLAYGPHVSSMYGQVAAIVTKVLSGQTPGQIPVERPTRFELRINLKTARSLGLVIPQSLVLRADRAIQ